VDNKGFEEKETASTKRWRDEIMFNSLPMEWTQTGRKTEISGRRENTKVEVKPKLIK